MIIITNASSIFISATFFRCTVIKEDFSKKAFPAESKEEEEAAVIPYPA